MSQNATYKHACGINFQGTTLLFWPKSLVDTVLVAKQMKNAQKDRDPAKKCASMCLWQNFTCQSEFSANISERRACRINFQGNEFEDLKKTKQNKEWQQRKVG